MFCIEKCSSEIEKVFAPKLGGADLIKLRHDFQVTHLHHSTQRSVCYTNQKFVIA